ncbi:metallophosphoesterase 1 [Ostrinia nubilalis]|uniref:metallophosphoesterase 1 n=1 Tax=Ostrinia nubilalis TaxID=29057 RepID=UPI00308229FE
MYLRRSTTLKYFVAAIVGAAFYCEWFIYIVQPRYWQRLECRGYDATCTKILFIADPQIQGDLAVSPPLSYLYNWDSDRYLKSTFAVAVNQFKPDVLVYLGDLMDEGSVSTMAQFHSYVKRLSGIFEVTYPVVQVWLPGDNDIGGETEPIKQDKVREFEQVFHQPSVITYKNISFYKVNGITHTVPKALEEDESNFKIVVSHYPITIRHIIGHKVNDGIRPNIYFCAHEHESKYVKQSKDLTHRETYPLYDEKVLEISTDEEKLYEIYVPTCSYRMGTVNIGFGAAILENNNEDMRYTVFWSPTRFPYLRFYLAVLICLTVYCLLYCAGRLFSRLPKHKAPNADKLPLLDRI